MVCAAAVWRLAAQAEAGPNCSVSDNIDAEEQAFLTLINDYRQQNGQQPLALSSALTRASAWKSQDLGANNYFAHDDLYVPRSWDQRIRDCGYSYNTWIGENIAAGNAAATDTFDQWRNSPGHNANMLSANYSAIGIARAYNAGAAYGWYWSTDFGGVNDGPPATATPAASPTATRTPTSTPTRTATSAPTDTATPAGQPVTPTQTQPGEPAIPTSSRTPVATMPLPTATPTRPPPPPAPRDPDGDVSCDGIADSIDAALVLQRAAQSIAALPCPAAGDVNRDGAISTVDALIILQYAAGLIAGLPV